MTAMRLAMLFPVTALALFGAGCATTNAAKHPGTPAEWRAAAQAPLSSEDALALSEHLDLAQALQLGVARNPMTAAARERWLARIKVEPQAVTPPDPMLEAGYQIRSTETRVGPVEWSLGLRQQLPWPQKLWARGRIAATAADIARFQYDAAVRDLIIDIKASYYELFYLDQAIPIVERTEALLRNDALLAYAELSAGRTQLNEAFRAESQAAQLGYDRLLLTEQRDAQAEQMRALLNLPPGTAIGPVRNAPVYAVSSEIEDLQKRAEVYAEVLKIDGLETQRAAYETFLARLGRIPDLTLGGTYNVVGEARTPISTTNSSGMRTTPPTPKMSSKDSVVGGVSMNLPIFEWRNRAIIQQQKALENAMGLDALADLNQLRAMVAQACFRVRLTERLAALYDDTLLPQAESVMDQAEILFRSGSASFSGLIETTLAHQNFTLARTRAIADHGQAIGELERLLGTTAEPREAEALADESGAPGIAEGAAQ